MLDDAIASFLEALELGAERPAVHFNLGLLYQQKQHFPEAIEQFSESLKGPEYALGSHFALGECHRAQGKIEEALAHFIEVLRTVDLQSALREQAEDVAQLYESLADRYTSASGDREKGLVFMSSLTDFLSSAGWEDRVAQARRRLDSLSEDGFTTTFAEMLETPDTSAVMASMGLSQEYLKRKMYLTAAEECYRAMTLAPGYLPLHLRLAEILLAQERFDEATAKYLAVAETYLARGASRQVMWIYRQVLRLAPMDVVVRARLIDFLTASGKVDDALNEYLALADAYYRMAQMDKAVDTYNQAARLVPRSSSKETWETRILHLLGDIYLQSVDWTRARRVYQRIVKLAPNDKRGRQNLADLLFKLEESQAGLTHLDALINQYRSEGAASEVLGLLHDMVQSHPQRLAIRSRLAQAYVEQEKREEAIAELNAVGELQVETGLYDEAADTIRQLAGLEPDKAQDYDRLRVQILSRKTRTA